MKTVFISWMARKEKSYRNLTYVYGNSFTLHDVLTCYLFLGVEFNDGRFLNPSSSPRPMCMVCMGVVNFFRAGTQSMLTTLYLLLAVTAVLFFTE